MVSLKDWDEGNVKIKILLKGYSATGKTRIAVKTAGILAKKGYHVLYLDGESGAGREMKQLKTELSGGELERVEYTNFADYKEMVNIITDNIKNKGDKLKLIIIDPMRLVEIARLSARDIYLTQGSAPSGYALKEIKNKDSFDLSGSAYQLATTMQLKFLNDLVNYKQDVICTLTIKETSKDEYKYKNEYDATFDFVYETLVDTVGMYNVYKAFPKKRRGAKNPDATLVDNLLGEVIGIFKEKYEKSQPLSEIKPIVVATTEMVAVATTGHNNRSVDKQ